MTTETTQYKGYTISYRRQSPSRGGEARYFVEAEGFRADGYGTLNTAKGAITKSQPAKAAAATSDGADRASIPASDGYKLSHDAPAQEWTTQRTPNGDPIHGNPRMAHTYALLDYYGMTRARDKRSRNKREGVYNGYTNGQHERAMCRNGGSRALFSRTSDYYAPTRKARKAAKLNARKGA